MTLIRTCLKLIVAAILPACGGGADEFAAGGGGSDPLAPGEPPYEADIFLDFEAGNPGEFYTSALMTSMQKGTPVRWSTSRALSHTKVRTENKPLMHPVKVGGMTYTGEGSRSLEFNLDEAIAKNLSPIFEHIWGYPPAGTGDIVISGMEYIGATPVPGSQSLGMDIVAINSGTFLVQQVGIGEVHIETQVPVGVTYKSTPMPRQQSGKWYYFALRYSRTTGRAELMLVDPETGQLVGTSGKKTASVSGGGDVSSFALQSYLIFGGGRNVFDNISISFSNPAYPPFRIPVLPAPSYVNATQTAPDQVRVTWPTTRAAGYKIERSQNGGAWTSIAEVYQEDGGRFYFDGTVKNGDQYRYRVSSFVGSQYSSPTTSSPLTVNNSPGGTESVWIAQTSGGTSRAVYFDGAANYISQKIRNSQLRHVSEVQLTYEFTGRVSELWVELWSSPDGTGTFYGASGTATLANGTNSYKFFAPLAVPASDFWMVLRDPYNWARTQVVTSYGVDVYEPGGGYNGYYGGGVLPGPSDLKFTIKTKE
jgi:hypothetical protein